MVRLIERSQVKNKGNFDKLFAQFGGKATRTDYVLMAFAQTQGVTHPHLVHLMHMYADKYPWVVLIKN